MWYVQNSAKPITCRDFHHQSGHTSTPEPTKVSLWNAWMNWDSFLQPERATRGHLGWPTLKSWKMRSMGDRPGIRFNGDMFVLYVWPYFVGYIFLHRPEKKALTCIYGGYLQWIGSWNGRCWCSAALIRSDTSTTGKIWKSVGMT